MPPEHAADALPQEGSGAVEAGGRSRSGSGFGARPRHNTPVSSMKGPDPNTIRAARVTPSSRRRNTMTGSMSIAAIDLGSNSLHMVLVDTDQAGTFRVIGREKEMVRLGARSLARGRLSAAAMKRAAGRAPQVQAAGGERGGGQGARRRHLGRARGPERRGLPGDDRPRARHLAAGDLGRRGGAAHLPGRPPQHPPRGPARAGGGHRRRQRRAGAGRAATPSSWASPRRSASCASPRTSSTDRPALHPRRDAGWSKHLDEVLEPHVERIRAAGFDTVVGTSGTILALGALALERGGRVPDTAAPRHGARRRDPRPPKWLAATDVKARLKIPGLDESRADIIVPGAVLLDTILQRLGARELVLCEWALREGILLDYIHQNPRSVARAEAYPDVRQRSVVSLAERCGYDEKHARKVAAARAGPVRRHASGGTAWARSQRSLLEYAALLHGDRPPHLVPRPPQARLLPHQERRPPRLHPAGGGGARQRRPLPPPPPAQEAPGVRRPAAGRAPGGAGAVRALRLADALDRSHRQVVKGLTVKSARRHAARAGPRERRHRPRDVGHAAAGGAPVAGAGRAGEGRGRAPRRPWRHSRAPRACARGRRLLMASAQADAAAARAAAAGRAPARRRRRGPSRWWTWAPARSAWWWRRSRPGSRCASSRRPPAASSSARTPSPTAGSARPTIEATLKALEGFRRIMDTYGVLRYRAVATSAVREAQNSDAFLDRVRLRTGLDVEVIDGSEENRLTYIAVREQLRDHPARDLGDALLVEVGGGSADISFLRKGQPIHSGTYPLGSIRMRQSLASWQGSHEQGVRLLRAAHPQRGGRHPARDAAARGRALHRPGRRRALRRRADPRRRRAEGRRARGHPRGLRRLLRRDHRLRRRPAPRALPPAPGGGGDAGARAAGLPRAAAGDGRASR